MKSQTSGERGIAMDDSGSRYQTARHQLEGPPEHRGGDPGAGRALAREQSEAVVDRLTRSRERP